MARKKSIQVLASIAVLLALTICGLAGSTFYALRLPEEMGDQDTFVLGQSRLVPGAPAARIALVWPLTREVASLSKRHNVKQRLQRHITRLERREG